MPLVDSGAGSDLSLSHNSNNDNDAPSRSTTPTQTKQADSPSSRQNHSSSSFPTLLTSSMRRRPSINQLSDNPEQPYLQLRPSSSSSARLGRSGSGDSNAGIGKDSRGSREDYRRTAGAGGNGSRQGASGPDNNTSAPTNAVSWLSLALFSDDPDDEDESNMAGTGDRKRSPTLDLLADHEHPESSDSAIDSSTEASSTSSISTDSSSFWPRRLHRGLYTSSGSSSRSRSSSTEESQGEIKSNAYNDKRKTRRSVSMLASRANDEKSRFISTLDSRPYFGVNQISATSPLQPSIELPRNGSFSPVSPSSRRKALFTNRHGHSRSSSSSDAYNIDIPSPSSSSRVSQELDPPTSPRWSTHARRLSSSLSKSASPYLKAGLDELRDIFDVESERDGWREQEWEKEKDKKLEEQTYKNSILPVATCRDSDPVKTLVDSALFPSDDMEVRSKSRHKNRPSTAPTWLESSSVSSDLSASRSNHSIDPSTSSSNLPSSLSLPKRLDASFSSGSHSQSHSRSGRTVDGLLSPPTLPDSNERWIRERQASAPSALEDQLFDSSPSSQSKLSTSAAISASHSQPPFTERLVHPGSASLSRNNSQTSEGGSGQLSPTLTLHIGSSSSEKHSETVTTSIDVMARRRIALGLILVGFGVLGIELLEYLRDPNAISLHLLAFFSFQSLFAFIGFFSLLAYNLSVMDLASRGIRAHVLAQACVALMALKELASTARYGKLELENHDMISNSLLVASRPSSSVRFGKLFRSAQDKAQDMIFSAYHHQAHPASLEARAYVESESASHAHETSVGNFSSQITYLIVFLVQAAIPIFVVMVLQYTVGRKLASLVRESRENLREMDRRKNRTLKNRRSMMKEKSVSNPSFSTPQTSNKTDPRISRSNSHRLNSLGVTFASPRVRNAASASFSTAASELLDPKDLSARLGQVQEQPQLSQHSSTTALADQVGFTASPSSLSPEDATNPESALNSQP